MLERIYKAQAVMAQACRKFGRGINIMEVCGTHTVSIFRSGIKSTLPEGLKLLSGPGCPVCVTSQGYIDSVLELAGREEVLIATYGDMIRVPGTSGSLETMQQRQNIRIVLSSEDALQLARDNPGRSVVFVAVGFETTAPATAVAVKEAAAEGIENFYVLSGHKLVVPAMEALLKGKNSKIDGFLCPGHVSTIIGYGAFKAIASQYRRPCVVAGFEPMQIIEGLAAVCQQLVEGVCEARSIYDAAVTEGGNVKAREVITDCFEAADGYWRGLGKIEKSTLKLKDEFGRSDAYKKFGIKERAVKEPAGCNCGRVLCGLMEPVDCGLFGTRCTPRSPVGPCMVSTEGACSAYFKYGQKARSKN